MSEELLKSNGERDNGTAVFDIDAITELIVPFEFPFEGSVLKGRWFKYKTVTPEWAAIRSKRFNDRVERFIEISAEMKSSRDTTLLKKLNKEKSELEDEAQRAQYEWLADAIVEWNAVGKGGPIPIESIRLKSFPIPFMVALGQHLEKDRSGENPTSSDS
jgi:hypothetical protein